MLRQACGGSRLQQAVPLNGKLPLIRVCRPLGRIYTSSRPGLRVAATAAADAGPRSGPRKAGYKKQDEEDIVEKGMRELPRPATVQQTLIQSFTLGGVGLHTGEYAYVRVRPAFAGEGRYFVRVPKGTNSDLFVMDDKEVLVPEDQLGVPEVIDPEVERLKVGLFMKYLAAQEDDGFKGSFQAFMERLEAEPLSDQEREVLRQALAAARQEMIEQQGEEAAAAAAAAGGDEVLFSDEYDLAPEDIKAADPDGEVVIPANIALATAEDGAPYITLAVDDENRVLNPVLLLAALEACGIDNARIEIEGGDEVPVLDNSSMGWSLNIQQAGVRTAPLAGAPSGGGAEGADEGEEGEGAELPPRLCLMPQQPFTVQRGESFVSFYPSCFPKVTAGIDVQDACAAIGQQWYSWRVGRDYHFRYELAGARGWVESTDKLFEMRAKGHLKCGAEGLFVIGYGERWWDPQLVRFHNDEPSRHQLLQLLGALALVGVGGNSGLPIGHVVSFNADPELHLDFAQALLQSCEESEENVVVDSDSLFDMQEALLEQEAADQDALGRARRQRAAALKAMGGPAVLPGDEEGEGAEGAGADREE